MHLVVYIGYLEPYMLFCQNYLLPRTQNNIRAFTNHIDKLCSVISSKISADDLYKQFVSRSGPDRTSGLIWIQIV